MTLPGLADDNVVELLEKQRDEDGLRKCWLQVVQDGGCLWVAIIARVCSGGEKSQQQMLARETHRWTASF
jgi:hypothetical protein